MPNSSHGYYKMWDKKHFTEENHEEPASTILTQYFKCEMVSLATSTAYKEKGTNQSLIKIQTFIYMCISVVMNSFLLELVHTIKPQEKVSMG